MSFFKMIKEFTGQLEALSMHVSARPDHIRTIAKGEFEGEWPFTVPTVTVAVVDSDYAVIRIESMLFALNGLAATKFKLTQIQKTKYYIKDEQGVGPSIQPIINLTLFMDRFNVPGERKVFNLK